MRALDLGMSFPFFYGEKNCKYLRAIFAVILISRHKDSPLLTFLIEVYTFWRKLASVCACQGTENRKDKMQHPNLSSLNVCFIPIDNVIKNSIIKLSGVFFIQALIVLQAAEIRGDTMVGVSKKNHLERLEHFIASAKKGSKISAAVDLQKQHVSQKVHPGDTEELKSEVDMYLLIANFTFKTGGKYRKVSKVYLFGSTQESADDARINKNIANARLLEDYKRLAAVNIPVEEKLF